MTTHIRLAGSRETRVEQLRAALAASVGQDVTAGEVVEYLLTVEAAASVDPVAAIGD